MFDHVFCRYHYFARYNYKRDVKPEGRMNKTLKGGFLKQLTPKNIQVGNVKVIYFSKQKNFNDCNISS